MDALTELTVKEAPNLQHTLRQNQLQKDDKTLTEQIKWFFANITVEPLLACFIMSSILSNLATINLSLEKACRVNMEYGEVVCDALTRRHTQNYYIEEETVQRMVARMAAWKSVIQSIFPCLLILFWGSWSDRHHRRMPCILIPIVGAFLGSIGQIICVYLKYLPMEVNALTEALFPSLCGGGCTLLMGVFSYIADITTEEQRTFRIGILNLCYAIGVPIGMAFSGVVLKRWGFYGVFGISAAMYALAFFYGVFILKEPIARPEMPVEQRGLLRDFFDKEHVVQTFRVAFKTGKNNRRLRVILLMIAVMLVVGPTNGESTVVYLFTRYRFNWNEVEFSFFYAFAMATGLLGVLICVVILALVRVDDAWVGVLSSVSKILSGIVYAFAVESWHMYVGAIVEIFNGTASIAMRSIATKLVCKDELGKVNSLFGIVEALMPFIFAPLYSILYALTLNLLPGAYNLVSAVLTVPAVIIFIWMYKFQRKQTRRESPPTGSAECQGVL